MKSRVEMQVHLKKTDFWFSGSAINSHLDSKVHVANMGHIWGRQDPGGPHVGSMKFAIWVIIQTSSLLNPHESGSNSIKHARLLN